jgi:hypothetical protein
MPRDRLKREGPDEPPGRPGHHRPDVVPALLKEAGDLDGLIGADAAAHAEADEGHGAYCTSS